MRCWRESSITVNKASRRHLVHRIEGTGAWLLFRLFGLLPFDAASWLGGFLAETIGPHLGVTKRARVNLRRAMPELGETEMAGIVRRMWNNIGRVVAEYAHLDEIDALFGQDFWPYGLAANRSTLTAFGRMLMEDGIVDSVPPLDRVFVPFN